MQMTVRLVVSSKAERRRLAHATHCCSAVRNCVCFFFHVPGASSNCLTGHLCMDIPLFSIRLFWMKLHAATPRRDA